MDWVKGFYEDWSAEFYSASGIKRRQKSTLHCLLPISSPGAGICQSLASEDTLVAHDYGQDHRLALSFAVEEFGQGLADGGMGIFAIHLQGGNDFFLGPLD